VTLNAAVHQRRDAIRQLTGALRTQRPYPPEAIGFATTLLSFLEGEKEFLNELQLGLSQLLDALDGR
jgi:hypothetical protein